MGQKVNPISNRLGIIRGWDSNWYGGNNYGDSLLEDAYHSLQGAFYPTTETHLSQWSQ